MTATIPSAALPSAAHETGGVPTGDRPCAGVSSLNLAAADPNRSAAALFSGFAGDEYDAVDAAYRPALSCAEYPW